MLRADSTLISERPNNFHDTTSSYQPFVLSLDSMQDSGCSTERDSDAALSAVVKTMHKECKEHL